MTKVSDAKKASNYSDKPTLPVCMNCKHYSSEMVLPDWMVADNAKSRGTSYSRTTYTVEANGVERNLRCKLHGFVIKKMASCSTISITQS